MPEQRPFSKFFMYMSEYMYVFTRRNAVLKSIFILVNYAQRAQGKVPRP